MKRRSFLAGFAAIITTPGVLMPVRKIVVPEPSWEIGRHDMSGVLTIGFADSPPGQLERLRNLMLRNMMDNIALTAMPPLLLGGGLAGVGHNAGNPALKGGQLSPKPFSFEAHPDKSLRTMSK